MRLLLDTHVMLWALASSPQIKRDLRPKIVDPDNDVLVSAASVWEICIKKSLGKLDSPNDLIEAIEASDFIPLSINFVHAIAAARLPRHHDDPFDRMLIAQAQTEGLVPVTRDRKLAAYQVEILNA